MEIISVVKDFLAAQNTDFALFMTGEWGSGKTFFLKHDLFKTIKTVKVNCKTRKREINRSYEPVYISLYGISEVNEVEKRILFELNPILKTKPAYVLNMIGKRFSNYIGGWFSKEDIRDFFSVFEVPKYKVLCFDDLERIDKKILNQSLGYINLLVEHQNIKVILIGDENILREKVPEFDKIKEKTIRFTYKFTPDISKTYDSFIETYPNQYESFLRENKDFVCEIFKRGEHFNLRTLNFSLDLFQKVYSFVEDYGVDKKFKAQVLDRLLFFITAYSIEYKKNNNISELAKLKQINSENILFSALPNFKDFLKDNKITVEETIVEEPSYIDSFQKAYLPFNDHYFSYFDVIADFVSTGFLKIEKIESDVEEIISDISRKEISEETIIIQRLSGFLTLKDDELAPLLIEILDKVENGKFELPAYPNLFLILMQIESFRIDDFKIEEETIGKFKRGIDISKGRAKYVESFRFKIPGWRGNDSRYELLSEYAIKANDSLLDQSLKVNADRIIPLIDANQGKELYDYIMKPENLGLPFFYYLDPNLIFKKIEASENSLIYHFTISIYDRHLKGYELHSMNKEKKFFTSLLTLVTSYLEKEKGNRIKNLLMLELSKKLEMIVDTKEYE